MAYNLELYITFGKRDGNYNAGSVKRLPVVG